MRAHEFLTEWRESNLYHGTDLLSAIEIWMSNKLNPNKHAEGVSTTRNYAYVLGYLKNSSENDGGVIFWLNQDKIKQQFGRRKLVGYDWFVDHDPATIGDNFQRRSWGHDTDRAETTLVGGLQPLNPFVDKIEIWLPRKFDYQDHSFNPGDDPDSNKKNIRVNNDRLQEILFNKRIRMGWEKLKADPRTEIKNELGSPRKHLGKYVEPRRQYSPEHPMYEPRYDDDR